MTEVAVKRFDWKFTDAQLDDTPSRHAGITREQEMLFRQKQSMLMQAIGQRSSLTQLAINSSVIFMHRFYMFRSIKVYPRVQLAMAFVFASGKVEESARKLEHLIRTMGDALRSKSSDFLDKNCRDAYEMDIKFKPKLDSLLNSNFDPTKEPYMEIKKLVLECETEIYAVIGFQLQITHPHNFVIRMCNHLGSENIKDISQYAYNLATASSQLTLLCLKYKPDLLAAVCLNIAAKAHCVKFECVKDPSVQWYQVHDIDTDIRQIEAVSEEFLLTIKNCPLLPTWMAQLTRTPRGNTRTIPRLPLPSSHTASRSSGNSVSLPNAAQARPAAPSVAPQGGPSAVGTPNQPEAAHSSNSQATSGLGSSMESSGSNSSSQNSQPINPSPSQKGASSSHSQGQHQRPPGSSVPSHSRTSTSGAHHHHHNPHNAIANPHEAHSSHRPPHPVPDHHHHQSSGTSRQPSHSRNSQPPHQGHTQQSNRLSSSSTQRPPSAIYQSSTRPEVSNDSHQQRSHDHRRLEPAVDQNRPKHLDEHRQRSDQHDANNELPQSASTSTSGTQSVSPSEPKSNLLKSEASEQLPNNLKSSASATKLSLSTYRERAARAKPNDTISSIIDDKPVVALTRIDSEMSLSPHLANLSNSDSFAKPQDSPTNPRIKIKVKRDPSSDRHSVKYAESGIKIKIRTPKGDSEGEAGPSGSVAGTPSTPIEEGEIIDESQERSDKKAEGALRIRIPVNKLDSSGYRRENEESGSNGHNSERERESSHRHHHSHHGHSKKKSSKHSSSRHGHERKSSKRSSSGTDVYERPSKSSRHDHNNSHSTNTSYLDTTEEESSSAVLNSSGFSINEAFSSALPAMIFDDDDEEQSSGPAPVTPTLETENIPAHHERFHRLMAQHRATRPPLPPNPPPSDNAPPPPPQEPPL